MVQEPLGLRMHCAAGKWVCVKQVDCATRYLLHFVVIWESESTLVVVCSPVYSVMSIVYCPCPCQFLEKVK